MNPLCDDFKQAERNREMVRLKQNIKGYLEIEQMVKNWPRRIPLPENLIGRIPSLGGHVPRELYEFHVIDDNPKGVVADKFRYAKPSGGFAVPFDDTGFEDLQDELSDSEEVNDGEEVES